MDGRRFCSERLLNEERRKGSNSLAASDVAPINLIYRHDASLSLYFASRTRLYISRRIQISRGKREWFSIIKRIHDVLIFLRLGGTLFRILKLKFYTKFSGVQTSFLFRTDDIFVRGRSIAWLLATSKAVRARFSKMTQKRGGEHSHSWARISRISLLYPGAPGGCL